VNPTWWVIEPEGRWLRLIRRFAPSMSPGRDETFAIVPMEASQVAAKVRHAGPAVVLWSLETQPAAKQNLAALASLFDAPPAGRLLHLVAIDPRLADRARVDLLQWGVILLDRPEQLAQYAPLVARFWRASRPAS